MASGDLGRRLMVAAVLIPLGVLVIYLGGWFLGAIIATVAALGAHEFYGLAAKEGRSRPFHRIGVLTAGLLVLFSVVQPTWSDLGRFVGASVIVLTLGSLLAATFRRGVDGAPLTSVATTVAGVLYTGGALSFAILVRNLPEVAPIHRAVETGRWDGASLLIFPLVVSWIGDSCAFFGGRRWGRRKLMPSVSPGKTVEGGISGLAGSLVAAVLFGALVLTHLPTFPVPVAVAAAMGLVIGVAAQAGDLAESVLKREAGVKDSGTLLPGHGGILDRFDAVLITIPLSFALYQLWAVFA